MNINIIFILFLSLTTKQDNPLNFSLRSRADFDWDLFKYNKLEIKTPNGSDVEVREYSEELSDNLIEESINEFYTMFGDTVYLLDNPTLKYNCYSHAFYNSNFYKNNYYVQSPLPYINDQSFVKSDGSAGDIVLLFSYGDPAHAGIVEYRINERDEENPLNDLNNIWVTSKWGMHGLYSHLGSNTPYYYADNVVYYKLSNPVHTHDFSFEYEWIDYKYHYAICFCGEKIQQGHIVAGGSFSDGKRYANCLYCGGLAEMGITINPLRFDSNQYEYKDGNYYVFETKKIDGILNLSYSNYMSFITKGVENEKNN